MPLVTRVRKPTRRSKAHGKPSDDLLGYEYFELLKPFLQKVEEIEVDPRCTFRPIDVLVCYLLRFFNPTITSLRGLQQATELSEVQRRLGIGRVSLGSFSEAATKRIFNADVLADVLRQLVEAVAVDSAAAKKFSAVAHVLTAVDGTLISALPRMFWALWVDGKNRAAKAHVQFELIKGVPVGMELTEGNSSEWRALARMLEKDRCYVLDRGYVCFQLYQRILDIGSSFVARVCATTQWQTIEDRPLTDADRQAGIRADRIVQLGAPNSKDAPRVPLRIVTVCGDDGVEFNLLTSLLDIDVDLVAEIYRNRWCIELFFRWVKCILGCRHLISERENGVALQVYAALIASVLIALWTGCRPTKRMYELVCLYFQGWATFEDVERQLERLTKKKLPAGRSKATS